ncbi:MAG: Tm-1-like ATP-binding domain-containing protein [Verrucomicrobiales bacterium]|nr:Tm-1-like ATP-binding domain-containing protein [Verrucomicrobiales bacterium]MCP5526427.1 Tm-1-like ATP-binding domain-containing protein [Verrucomicrobiales bacterium]
MPVFLIATLDTKGAEAVFVRDCLNRAGVEVRLVDAGCLGEPASTPDVPRAEVFAAAGTSLEAMRDAGDRGLAVTRAAEGVTRLMQAEHARGNLDGVLGLGGSAGTTIATSAMRALPVGVPKVMVSTLAAGQVRPFVGGRDLLMLYSVVDILGINRISRAILTNAAHAMAGMVRFATAEPRAAESRPLLAATMFGVTTPCVERARAILEAAGYEVLVFHATGVGGETMEGLIRDGVVRGVLDMTTTELADEIVGGLLSAGPNRLTAAASAGVPQVVSVGATDMVNFFGPATVPERFRKRNLHRHNENVTLMRTTAEENERIGADIGRKLAASRGPVTVLLPARGVSALDIEGGPFDDPEARRALFGALRAHAGTIPVIERDRHINEPEFAEEAARTLLDLLDRAGPAAPSSTPGISS